MRLLLFMLGIGVGPPPKARRPLARTSVAKLENFKGQTPYEVQGAGESGQMKRGTAEQAALPFLAHSRQAFS
jgi:hypothetical protein